MGEQNLALDIVERGEGAGLLARIYVEFACSYRKDAGGPIITADCGSVRELARETARLKSECDALLAMAQERFAGAEPMPEPPDSAGKADAKPGRPAAAEKLPLTLSADLRVEDRMTRDVRTARRNDNLSLADELMKVGRFRHVVVLEDDGDEVAGVISQRDIFYGALAWSSGLGSAAYAKMLETQPVKAVMQTDVETVTPDTALVDAAHTLLEKRIGCLPVVENGNLVGILTEGDFLSLLTESAEL